MEGIRALLNGLSTTLRILFRRPVTEQYPEYKRPLPERSRGVIILTRDPDGEERCVACYLCSGVCPVSCISMQSAERPNGRRYPRWFRINFGRCIYCGLCEEACPTLAIQLTPHFETSQRDVLKLVLDGKSNKSIANELAISERTVKIHLQHVYRKLGVHRRVDLLKAFSDSMPAARSA